jgi:hypothetical protein
MLPVRVSYCRDFTFTALYLPLLFSFSPNIEDCLAPKVMQRAVKQHYYSSLSIRDDRQLSERGGHVEWVI